MNIKKNLLFIDAEAYGLYGDFISVAMKLIDTSTGEELDKAYFGIAKEKLCIKEEWVKDNVEKYLGDYSEQKSENDLIESVWSFWDKYKSTSYVITDVGFPVESRLFIKCVENDKNNRLFEAPFPLLDLSSMLLSIGIEPLVDRESLIKEKINGNKHNAMYDVDVMIAVWKQYFFALK